MTALRLIIENHPSWQTPVMENFVATPNLPAPSQTIYTILGRRNAQWHTIVPRIEQADDALQAMDSANRSELFDRLVIASATSIGGQPAGRWDTYVCALPLTALAPLPKRSFEELLERAERRQASAPTPTVYPAISTAIAVNPNKRDASLWLLILFGIGLWSQAWPVLTGVTVLCLLEMLYQRGTLDRIIPPSQRAFVQTGRFYLYSICAGLIAIPLMAGLMLQIADFLGR